MMWNWTLQTRYTLWRNTASLMKGLVWLFLFIIIFFILLKHLHQNIFKTGTKFENFVIFILND